MKLNKYIDHTLLKPEATKEQIKKLCEEAMQYDFKSVCVNPTHVAYTKELLQESSVLVCTVIGFPLGANTAKVKAFETLDAIANGAQEIDMVINIGAVKEGNYELVKSDIQTVVEAADGVLVKVIVETCLLTEAEKTKMCQIVIEAGAQFIKTSTGFSTGGATKADIALFNENIQGKIQIKASGGVRTIEDAKTMITSGATRLGTSGGVNIINGQENTTDY
ncbi:MAG: deoxyribose-phosphate aldolase [Mycoplasmatales bacterium]